MQYPRSTYASRQARTMMGSVRKMPSAHIHNTQCPLPKANASLHWITPPANGARCTYQDSGSLNYITHPFPIFVNPPINSATKVGRKLQPVNHAIHVLRGWQSCKMMHSCTSRVLSMPRCAPIHCPTAVLTTPLPSKLSSVTLQACSFTGQQGVPLQLKST